MMLLVVDIGNTNITLGIYDGTQLLGSFRLTTKMQRTSDEFGIVIHNFLMTKQIQPSQIEDVIISSVVPKVMHSFNNSIRKYINVEPIIIGPGTKTGISVKTEFPKEVGTDRVVNAAAVYEYYGGPSLIIDFGTATTFDYINAAGEFLYVIISPGLEISAQALWTQTAKLPEIEIKKLDSILTRNTITSMQAGVVFGYIGQVEYIINQVKKELNQSMQVIATGGLGRIIFNETNSIDIYDADLTFKGMKVIYDKLKKNL